MRVQIPIALRGSREVLTVHYGRNASASESGFDALDLPFPAELCIGYPAIHAYFEHMNATGYRRYCGFIQIVQRIERREGAPDRFGQFVDVDDYANRIGNPYFSYGYPASLYDAPCSNLGDSDALDWTAFTYLVDMPTRMNRYQLGFLAGFSWGYAEDKNGPGSLHDLKLLTNKQFERHRQFLLEEYPDYKF
jgi:hypothetical protein